MWVTITTGCQSGLVAAVIRSSGDTEPQPIATSNNLPNAHHSHFFTDSGELRFGLLPCGVGFVADDDGRAGGRLSFDHLAFLVGSANNIELGRGQGWSYERGQQGSSYEILKRGGPP